MTDREFEDAISRHPLTVEAVGACVKYIADIASDDEAAHAREDDLHEAVLRAIAEGAADASGLAREALRTTDITFARWCA